MIPLLVPIGLGLLGGYLSKDSTKKPVDVGVKNKFENGGVVTYQDLSKQKPVVVNEESESATAELKDLPIIDLVRKGSIKEFPVKKIQSSKDSVELIRLVYNRDALNTYESAYAILLNRANAPIYIYEHSKGSIDGTIMDAEMIVATAVKSLARGIIIVHNHPSGNLQPSRADEDVTLKIAKGCNFLGIKLLDSIILTSEGYLSFADEGMMPSF
jgi:DNA repair protein RadC